MLLFSMHALTFSGVQDFIRKIENNSKNDTCVCSCQKESISCSTQGNHVCLHHTSITPTTILWTNYVFFCVLLISLVDWRLQPSLDVQHGFRGIWNQVVCKKKYIFVSRCWLNNFYYKLLTMFFRKVFSQIHSFWICVQIWCVSSWGRIRKFVSRYPSSISEKALTQRNLCVCVCGCWLLSCKAGCFVAMIKTARYTNLHLLHLQYNKIWRLQ